MDRAGTEAAYGKWSRGYSVGFLKHTLDNGKQNRYNI